MMYTYGIYGMYGIRRYILSISCIHVISTPDEVLVYVEYKRLTPADSHVLSLCIPLPNFFSPLPSYNPSPKVNPSRPSSDTKYNVL